MKSKTLLSVFCLLFSVSFLNSVRAQVNKNDSLALVQLYDSTNGYNWANNTNWKTNMPVSQWFGITVNNNHVISIDLESNALHGYIPQSIGNITYLQTLILTNNLFNGTLTGPLPASIGNLQHLITLDLNSNRLQFSLPATIVNMTALQTFNVSNNTLSGELPADIGKLKNLVTFDAHNNKQVKYSIGFSGAIPGSFGQCSNLRYLDLSGNSLNGSIPASLGNCNNLMYLILGANNYSLIDAWQSNNLTGGIPSTFQKLTNLVMLNLTGNQLSGPVKNIFSSLTQLKSLSLGFNMFSGNIPYSLGKCTNLTLLYLRNNQLTGPITVLNKLKMIDTLWLSNNQLSGDIPLSLFSISVDSQDIHLSYNHFTNRRNPKYTGPQIAADFYIAGNNLTFDGQEYFSKKYRYYDGSGQAPLPIHINNNTLSVYAGGTLSNNIYHWYMVGSTTPTTITGDSTYQPPTNGNYYATIENKVNSPLKTDTVQFTKNTVCPSSLASNELKISISPNPVRSMIQITGLNDKANAKITLADMSGCVWMSTMTRNQTMLQLDVSRLKPGNYLINVNDEKGAVKTIQFVKE